MGIQERIKDIELELSRTQINKATSTHVGLLKGQLARLRTQLLLPAAGAGGQEGILIVSSYTFPFPFPFPFPIHA